MQNKVSNPARSFVEALASEYKRLEREAGDTHILFANIFAGGMSFKAEKVGNIADTDFVYIAGGDGSDHDSKIIQHYTQVSIVFTFKPISELTPAEEERRPIGFITR